jgi:hypothetical protein
MQAQLHDAERVLCTIGMLKKGMCSDSLPAARATRPAKEFLKARLGISRGHTSKRAFSHIAHDVASNVENMFSTDGGGAAR